MIFYSQKRLKKKIKALLKKFHVSHHGASVCMFSGRIEFRLRNCSGKPKWRMWKYVEENLVESDTTYEMIPQKFATRPLFITHKTQDSCKSGHWETLDVALYSLWFQLHWKKLKLEVRDVEISVDRLCSTWRQSRFFRKSTRH